MSPHSSNWKGFPRRSPDHVIVQPWAYVHCNPAITHHFARLRITASALRCGHLQTTTNKVAQKKDLRLEELLACVNAVVSILYRGRLIGPPPLGSSSLYLKPCDSPTSPFGEAAKLEEIVGGAIPNSSLNNPVGRALSRSKVSATPPSINVFNERTSLRSSHCKSLKISIPSVRCNRRAGVCFTDMLVSVHTPCIRFERASMRLILKLVQTSCAIVWECIPHTYTSWPFKHR